MINAPQTTLSTLKLVIAGLVLFLLTSAVGGFHSLHNLVHYGIPIVVVGLVVFAISCRHGQNRPPA